MHHALQAACKHGYLTQHRFRLGVLTADSGREGRSCSLKATTTLLITWRVGEAAHLRCCVHMQPWVRLSDMLPSMIGLAMQTHGACMVECNVTNVMHPLALQAVGALRTRLAQFECAASSVSVLLLYLRVVWKH